MSYNLNSGVYSSSDSSYITDNNTNNQISQDLSGLSSDTLIGFNLSFVPTISGNFYSQHNIDFGYNDFRLVTDLNVLVLSPYSIPNQAYVQYLGTFDFQIYDGSVDYDRWIYDNQFVITKPVSVSFNHVNEGSHTGANYTISVPSLSSSDIINVTAYRNLISSYTSFSEKSIEDYAYDNIRIGCEVENVYVLYDIDSTNFVPYNNVFSPQIPASLDNSNITFIQWAESFNNNVTFCNVSDIDYLDDTSFSLKNIANGFSVLRNSLTSSLSNVVTNATDNANRIIQNTTQKVDEVKQGVTDVKNSVVETKNSILDLPNKIKEMLIGLVVPDDESINSKYSEFETLLSDRFGLIYQSADIIHDFADSFQTQAVMTADTGGIITMPQVTVSLAGTPFTFGGYEVDIIPDGFETLQQMCRLAVSMVCTVVFINMLKSKLEWILR